MPTPVWSGTLSFGLVAIPVRLIPATEPKDVRFHLYDRAGRRVRYQRVAEGPSEPPEPPTADRPPQRAEEPARTNRARGEGPSAPAERSDADRSEPIPWEHLMRGRETESGEVVLLAHEEIEGVRPQRSRAIDIEDFVALEDIDPVYFDKTYYAIPQSSKAARPYVLLHRAMGSAGRVGIGRFVLRTKPHLVAVRPMQEVLVVETMFFGDEVRDPAALILGPGEVEIDERELRLAGQLIETLQTDWNPAAYADVYREELLRLLSEKVPTPRPPEAPAGEAAGSQSVSQLMAALKESVEATKKAKRRATRKSG